MLFSFPLLVVRCFTLAVPTLTISSSSNPFPLKSSEAHRFPSLISNNTTSRSSSNNDTTYSANAINAILPTCFSQPPDPSGPHLHTITIGDCFEVLYEVVRSPIALVPNVWDPRFRQFPVWNVFGTCAVGLVPRYKTSRDVFPELLIAHVAAVVIESCVKAKVDEKVGGVALIGARNEFEVCVYGRDHGAVAVLGAAGMNDTAFS